jgi:hypothetical protein
MVNDVANYGKPISVQLSALLREMLNSDDYKEISEKHNISRNYLHKIVRRQRNLNENNAAAIEALTKIAVSALKRVNLISKKI